MRELESLLNVYDTDLNKQQDNVVNPKEQSHQNQLFLTIYQLKKRMGLRAFNTFQYKALAFSYSEKLGTTEDITKIN